MKWVVETTDLAATLQTLASLSLDETGDASWRLGPDAVSVAWAGMELSLPAGGEAAVAVRVSPRAMSQLLSAAPRRGGAVEITLKDGRLRFGTFSVGCEVIDRAVPQLLPVGATPLDVALLPHRHDRETIAQAGLTGRVEEVLEEVRRSAKVAADALAWLGVRPVHVEAWVEAHLRARAMGETPPPSHTPAATQVDTKVMVVDGCGQIELL